MFISCNMLARSQLCRLSLNNCCCCCCCCCIRYLIESRVAFAPTSISASNVYCFILDLIGLKCYIKINKLILSHIVKHNSFHFLFLILQILPTSMKRTCLFQLKWPYVIVLSALYQHCCKSELTLITNLFEPTLALSPYWSIYVSIQSLP